MRMVFALSFLLLIILLLIFLFRKANLHFKLLKELFPGKLSKVNSALNPMLMIKMLDMEGDIYFWYYFPFYFKKMKLIDGSNENATKLNTELLKNNKIIGLILVLFLVWFLIGYMFLFNKGN